MKIASQKRKENIAEYLLYMWQIEDLIRANDLDIDRIQKSIIDLYTGLTDDERRQMRDWYESLIDMMRREDVAVKGHLQLNKNVIIQLEDLHRRLMADPKFATYNAEYYKTLPFIVELRAKAGEQKLAELETCFAALYGLMMLRLQGKEISPQTQQAAQQISHFLAMLAAYYKRDSEGTLFNDNEP